MEFRPSIHQCMMGVAKLFAQRSTCSRLKVGCVITTEDGSNIVSIGYNGSYKGGNNECLSDEPGNCGHSAHAELNALIKADYSIKNKKLYVTHSPCSRCATAIVNAGITEVYYNQLYRSPDGLQILDDAGIPHHHLLP